MAAPSQSGRLRKELSLFSVYTIATGATLSSGFFLLPGLAAVSAGPAVVLSYLLAVVPILPGILSKIELATAMPRAGGEYYFLDRSLGPLVGTIAGLGTWCGLVLKTAFALIGIAAYLGVFFPDLKITPWVIASAILFGLVNLLGSRRSGSLQTVLVMGLLLLLGWFIATGVFEVKTEYTQGFLDRGWYQILSASGLVCVSFMGLTNVASIAEEVKDPERNLTLGIFLALGTSVLVYGLGTYVIVGVVPPQILYPADAPSLTPVADAARVMAGPVGAGVMTVAAVLACLSVGNAGILSASRYPLAMSRDHLLPAWFRRLNGHNAPRNGIIVTVAMILVFVTVLDAAAIAKLASAFLLLLFAFNCLAVLVMRESRIESYDPGFRSPGYPWVQIVGIIAPLALIAVMGWLPVVFTAGIIAVGTAWYLSYASKRVVRTGAIYHLFARLGQHRFEGLDRELRGILKEKGIRHEDPYDHVVATARAFDAPGQVTFEQVVHQAAEMLAADLPLNSQQIESKLMEGTRVGATPTARGVALPHLRLAGIRHPLMVIARTPEGVRVEVAADLAPHGSDQPIYAVFFLISPEHDAAQHLRLLAHVAQRVEDEDFMANWLAAKNEQKLKEILVREGHFLSLTLNEGSATADLIGRTLRDLSFPDGSLIALINRSNDVVVPDGHTILHEQDTITIVGLPKSIRELRERYEQDETTKPRSDGAT